MEKKNNTPRICKICNRRFTHGKAMGGHMRSHLLKLKLAAPLPPSSNSLSSPSSETESPKTAAGSGRRSKRLRKLAFNNSPVPSDSVSSFSLSSEDAAMCLLMLSKDERMCFDEDDDDEFSGKTQLKYYRCETCNKSFRSHQALGGHKASHNHKNKQVIEDDDDDDDGEIYHHQRRVFECPFCDKVFQSGQALGGHKKVHFAYLPVAAADHNDKAFTNSTSSSTVQSFDLNLPASDDDDDYDEDDDVSLFENVTPS